MTIYKSLSVDFLSALTTLFLEPLLTALWNVLAAGKVFVK